MGNVPLIKELGGLFCAAYLRAHGHAFLPGGNQISLDADISCGRDKYVHLCLTPGHPMLYLAKVDGRIKKSSLIRVDPSVLTIDGVQFAFDVSNKNGAEICPIADASERIDYVALNQFLDWNIPENQARRAAIDKCEILVPEHIPVKYLTIPNG
jgi:hypothetical protein